MRRSKGVRVLIGIASVVLLALSAQGQTTFHEKVSLNGTWTFTPLDSTPASIPPGPITVPSWWSDGNPDWDNDWISEPLIFPDPILKNKEIKRARYERTLVVPATMAGKRIKLRFEAVNYTCEVKINGQSAGTKHYNGFIPFEYDITGLVVADGTTVYNLEVTVGDFEDGDMVTGSPGNYLYMYPMGHPPTVYQLCGIADNVTLYAVPAVYVKDVFVKPDVTNNTITLSVTVTNNDTIAYNGLTVAADIYKILGLNPESLGSTPALTVTSGTVNVPAGGQTVTNITAPWTDPVLWWPEAPQLYRLHAQLKQSTTVIDENKDVRFGFREFKVDGNRYSLNGVPFHGWGDSTNMIHWATWNDRAMIEYAIDVYKNAGCRLIRHGAGIAPSSLYYDICDEKGMLCYAEMNYNAQNVHNYGDIDFEAHVNTMMEALVTRDRNHPSIAIWSLSNEIFFGSSPNYVSYRDTLAGHATFIANNLDNTRPIGDDADGSLDGRLAIKNKHYPKTVAHINNNGPDHGSTNDFSANPFWVLGIAEPTVPLGVGECMYNDVPSSDPVNAYYSANWGFLKALMIRAYRLAGFSDIRPFTLLQEAFATNRNGSPRRCHMVTRHSMAPVAVYDFDYDSLGVLEAFGAPSIPSYSEGAVVNRNYIVFNDDLALNDPNVSSPLNTSVKINWEVSLYGTVTSSGTQTVTVPLGEVLGDNNDFLPLSWTVPQVEVSGTPFVVGIEAEKNGQRMFKTHYVFLANDAGSNPVSGLDPATHKGTFVDDFETSVDNGWREHDNFWTSGSDGVAASNNLVYRQPETRGLFPFSRWGQSNGDRTLNPYKFGMTWKGASPRAYKYQNLRASCDIKILTTDGVARGAGIGLRMAQPDSSPWLENDSARRSGYFVKIHHDNGAYSLKIGKATSTNSNWVELATASLVSPGANPIHLEVTAQVTPSTVLTATASCISWTSGPVTISTNDSQYTAEGYVSLIMEERVAAEYDNVQFGTAPYPPEITSYPVDTGTSHSATLVWSTETDWGGISANVQYKVDWSTNDEQLSGSSPWITGTTHTFTNLPGGRLWFHVRARDASQQVSAPSQARMSKVDPQGDQDGDGISNEAEFTLGSNVYNADTDGDGMDDGDEVNGCTDLFDTDSDDDGLIDGDEIAHNANPCVPDTDGDGINDGTEVAGCSEPDDADTDGDTLEDGDEVAIGTDPCDTDTDNDQLADNLEAAHGCDPLIPDTDHDGDRDGREVLTLFTDPLNKDSDGDAFFDGQEDWMGTDPLDPAIMPANLDWALTTLGFGSALNTADYNGPAPTYGANGIPDSFELAVIAQIVRNPNHPLYAVVRAAWVHNLAQMYVDLALTTGTNAQYNARSIYLAAYMTLGDANSIAAAEYWGELFVPTPNIVPANYITGALPGCVAYLAKTGDADVDNTTNQAEYNATLPLSGIHANDLQDYLNAVLTPALRLALSAPAVRIGQNPPQSITITLLHNWPPHVMPSPITWTATAGTLTGSGLSRTYTPPATRGWALVTCQGPGFKVSAPVFAYSRWMMLKSDDMREVGFIPTPRPANPTIQQLAWERFISFMEGRHLRGNFGVISDSLDVDSSHQPYFDWLKGKRDSGQWELWCHGYDHGNVPTPEFQGPTHDLAYQLDHLKRCQNLAVEKLGMAYQSFAPPFNAADSNTTLAMNDATLIPDFNVWLQAAQPLPPPSGPPPVYEHLVLNSTTPEQPVFIPNFNNFVSIYNAIPAQPYFVAEFHPGAFGQGSGLDANFTVYKSIIDWLCQPAQNVTFIRVMEYYDLVTSGIVPMDGRLDSDADGILDIDESRFQDLDNDKIPDYLDADSDNDGINDGNEDSDGDTYKDAEEIRMGFDEFDAAVPDTDKDLYFNAYESLAGTIPTAPANRPRDLDAGLTVYGATNLETFDVNGASGANGIPDSYELTLMTEEVITIRWSCNSVVKPAWRKNLIQMYADLRTANEPWTANTLAAKAAVLAGYMTVGDANSVAVAVNYIQARDGVIDTTKYTTGSYPGNQDWLAWNKDADFDTITNVNEYVPPVPGSDHRANLDAYLVKALAPDFDAIMLFMGWNKTLQDTNSEAAGQGPNGMLDAHELALVEAILRNTGDPLYSAVRNAYQQNLLVLLGAEFQTPNYFPRAAIYAGYATLGDTGSLETVDVQYNVNMADFDTTQSTKVAKAGDADTDGRLNGSTSGTEYFNAQAVFNHSTQFDLFQAEYTGRALNPGL